MSEKQSSIFQHSDESRDGFQATVRSLRELVEGGRTLSTVEANAAYIRHLRRVLPSMGNVRGHRLLKRCAILNETSSYTNSVFNYISNADLAETQGKKRPHEELIRTDNAKRIKTGNIPYLPLEVMSMVMSHAITVEPRCALDFVVPDWKVCSRENPTLEKLLKITRVVTYTRGTDYKVGTLSCNFGHEEEDHILTSMTVLDRNLLTLNVWCSSEYTKEFYRSHTHVFSLAICDLSREMAEKLLANNWRELVPLRGLRATEILPFDDEPFDTTKKRAILLRSPIYEHLRHIAVHSPLELLQVNAENSGILDKDARGVSLEVLNNALDIDRSAHLWLSWSQMPKLESVFLDLRIYSHDINTEHRCLSKYQIVDRAQEMGRHLQLKILMLAGLQSYSFETRYDIVTASDIEQWDEISGEPNWIKIFGPAVRPGGKIVLVDRLMDDLSNWPEMGLGKT
ncbi:hypothetical protein F5Y19DRAFT_475642 [Xylariaceae sp. FL1651]|nr:hypothetical protein F5Y19DRAFT_475642 [Xylariaceae sp. FL1651]